MLYLHDYNLKESDIKYISSDKLNEFATHIKNFTSTYRKYIRINSEKEIRILDTLDNFADMIFQRKYKELFDDDVVIDYSDENYREKILNSLDLDNDEIPF